MNAAAKTPVGTNVLSVNERSGDRIRERREALGMSVSALAKEAEVDRTYLGDFEKGLVSPKGSWVGAVDSALARIEEEAGMDTPSRGDNGDDLVEFTIEGNFGVRAVVKGPVRDMAELKAAVADLIREMGAERPAGN